MEYFINNISSTIATINFNYVLEVKYSRDFKFIKTNRIFSHFQAKKLDSAISLDDLINFALKSFTHKYHSLAIAGADIIKRLTKGLVKMDHESLIKRNNQDYDDEDEKQNNKWHILEAFRDILEQQNVLVKDFVDDFK